MSISRPPERENSASAKPTDGVSLQAADGSAPLSADGAFPETGNNTAPLSADGTPPEAGNRAHPETGNDTDPVTGDGASPEADGPSAYDALRLENQLCFPLYACSRAVVRQYKPLLEPLGLTYTQYITMLVLWERGQVTGKELGACLFLDSGTLTPVLKKLEGRGLLERRRDPEDERSLLVSLTEAGEALRREAVGIPHALARTVPLSMDEAGKLYRLLYKLLSAAPDA